MAPPVGELSSEARLRGEFGQRSQRFQRFQRFHDTPTKSTKPTISTKSRFHGTPRKARFQRNQRNHDFTAPQRNHESNETHENNEMPLLRAFRFFRGRWINRWFRWERCGKLPSQSRFARQLPHGGSQAYRRQTRRTACKAKPQRSAPYHNLADTHGRALASPCGGGGTGRASGL